MDILIGLVVLIFSAILHEVMHGFVADKLGDPTARYAGRLTLNPIPHLDPIMSVILPALLVFSGSPIVFGAAKPVPVNPLNLRDGYKDSALVALAGPLTNLTLAALAAAPLRFAQPSGIIGDVFFIIVLYNLSLGFLNLIPIPPLDGSKVISAFLPPRIAYQYESISQFGIFILFFLLLFPIGPFSLGDLLSTLVFSALRLLGIS